MKTTVEKKRDEALKRALQMKPQKHGSKIDKPLSKKRAKNKAAAEKTAAKPVKSAK